MGKRGPKPKDAPPGIDVPKGRPSPPRHLEPEEVAVFESICDRLDQVPDLLSTLDAEPIAQMAEAWCSYLRAIREIKKAGGVTIETKGGLRRHPEAVERDAAAKRFLDLASSYGMTPKDRNALVQNTGREGVSKDPLANLAPKAGVLAQIGSV